MTAFILSSSPDHSIAINVQVNNGHRYASVRFRGLEAHRVKYNGCLRFDDEKGTGWLRVAADSGGRETAYHALYCTRENDICADPTDAAKKKILAMLTAAVDDWEREYGFIAFTIAGLKDAQDTHDTLKSDIEQLEKDLATHRAAFARSVKALNTHASGYSANMDAIGEYNKQSVAL